MARVKDGRGSGWSPSPAPVSVWCIGGKNMAERLDDLPAHNRLGKPSDAMYIGGHLLIKGWVETPLHNFAHLLPQRISYEINIPFSADANGQVLPFMALPVALLLQRRKQPSQNLGR